LLPVQDLECRLLQVLPLVGSPGRRFANGDSLVEDGDKEVKWPSLGVRKWECDSGVMEIEPGESETFQVDYHVPASLEVVRLYSHLNNTTKKTKIGWAHSMNIDLRRRDTWAMIDIERSGSNRERRDRNRRRLRKSRARLCRSKFPSASLRRRGRSAVGWHRDKAGASANRRKANGGDLARRGVGRRRRLVTRPFRTSQWSCLRSTPLPMNSPGLRSSLMEARFGDRIDAQPRVWKRCRRLGRLSLHPLGVKTSIRYQGATSGLRTIGLGFGIAREQAKKEAIPLRTLRVNLQGRSRYRSLRFRPRGMRRSWKPWTDDRISRGRPVRVVCPRSGQWHGSLHSELGTETQAEGPSFAAVRKGGTNSESPVSGGETFQQPPTLDRSETESPATPYGTSGSFGSRPWRIWRFQQFPSRSVVRASLRSYKIPKGSSRCSNVSVTDKTLTHFRQTLRANILPRLPVQGCAVHTAVETSIRESWVRIGKARPCRFELVQSASRARSIIICEGMSSLSIPIARASNRRAAAQR